MQAAPKTLVDVAYRALRHRILDGSLPPGSKLRVEHLREEIGVGATPLREALSRLAAERLVRSEGQRGFRVAPMSLEELDDLTDNRVVLETRAVQLSVERGGAAWEAALVAAHTSMAQIGRTERGKGGDFSTWDAHNAAFHDALVAACGSPWLLELRGIVFDQHSRYRAYSAAVVHERGGRDVEVEHDAILEAARARKAKRAAALVADHIRETAVQLRAGLGARLAG